jgi:glycosyltransferase involved in cell wall biosynthesis
LYAGWCGRNDHHFDWATAAIPLRVDTGLKFKLGGVDDFTLTNDKAAERYWKFIANAISGGKSSEVQLYKSTDVYNYATFYNEIDIVLLPSHNTDYALCKSNLKLLESAAHSLPVVSNGGAYKEVNGKIGLRVESARDWGRHLKKLKESKRMRTELGQALNEWAKVKYNFEKINDIRYQTL